MIDDPIIEELRKFREEYAAKFNYDFVAMCQNLREQEKQHQHLIVSRSPKPYIPPTLETVGETLW
jgi:hypothetical protein